MPLISLDNDKLFLQISPEMGASITKFKNVTSGEDIFRPLSNKKKIIKKNCYFSGYFATVPYFGAISKKTFLYKKKYVSLSKTHPLEPDTIHGEGWVSEWKIKSKSKISSELVYIHDGKKGFPFKYRVNQEFFLINKSLCINIAITNIDNESFNCGIGFCLIINPKNLKKIDKYFAKQFKPYVIGKIIKGKNKVNLNARVSWN